MQAGDQAHLLLIGLGEVAPQRTIIQSLLRHQTLVMTLVRTPMPTIREKPDRLARGLEASQQIAGLKGRTGVAQGASTGGQQCDLMRLQLPVSLGDSPYSGHLA